MTIAVGFVVASLLAVVIGNMTLAQGQLRLEQVDSKLVAAQSAVAGQLVQYTHQESPAVVALEAKHRHLVQPSEILPIKAVSLSTPLGPPTFSSAPCCAVTPGR